MRRSIFFISFLLLSVMLTPITFASSNSYINHFAPSKTRTNPYRYIGEALRDNISTDTFFRVAKYLTTYRAYEAILRTETVHNPLIFKQGGRATPTNFPRATPIAGPPFDIYTPTGVIPGCLNLLCPSPKGAIYFAGVCWCTS